MEKSKLARLIFKNLWMQDFFLMLSIISASLIFLNSAFVNLEAQAIYSGPAFGQIAGGAQVSTTLFEGSQSGPVSNTRWINNKLWEKYDPPLVADVFNNTPAAAPLGSNEFIDPSALLSPLQTIHRPAVVIDFEGSSDPGNYIPPDPHMAAGPNHVIVVDNSRFIIFDKMGNSLLSINAKSWYSNVDPLPNVGIFDCQIIYDHFAERWVQEWMVQDDNSQTSYWMLSISDDSNPIGTWCNFAFPNHLNGSNNVFNWGDYPKIGYDQQAFYISGRQFAFAGGFNYCKMRIIPKSQLYDLSCGPVDYTDFWNFRDPNNPNQVVDGPPIAATHIDSTNTAYIVVDSPYNFSTFITLWTIEDPLSANPVVSAVNIPTTAALSPPNGNQLGGGSPRIDSGRRTYRNAVFKDRQIWTANAVAGGTGNAYAYAHYLRLNVDTQSVLEDVSFGANGFYYLYPAIMVDKDNNMTMVFTRSADTEYAGAAYTGRRETDPPGLAPSNLFKEGEANYVKTFGGTRNRWGDYMGIALDPVNRNTIWGFVEYAASPANTWGIWVGEFTHEFSASGFVKDESSGNPIEFANIDVVETGRTFVTDSTGNFSFGSPFADININASAFAYRDSSVLVTLTSYQPDTFDILLQPQFSASISGQVFDPSSSTGVEAKLEFFAEGNPYPGPYRTVFTDGNGNYSLNTIIGNYDIKVYPQSPYPYTEFDSVALDISGLNFNIELDPADVLIVDDDQGSEYEIYFLEALVNLNKTYHLWNTDSSGVPSAVEMSEYPSKKVIWFTGDGVDSTISEAEQQEILTHINNDGKVFITGQNIAEQINGSALLDTLGLAFSTNTNLLVVAGVAGDIGDGLVFTTAGSGGANNQNSRDQLAVTDSSTTRTIFTYATNPVATAAVAYEKNLGKVVLFGFGWEAIGVQASRETVLQLVLDYLDALTGIVPANILSNIPDDFQLFQNYPNPFNSETVIQFGVPEISKVKIDIYNTLGQRVSELANEHFQPGYYRINWDGKNQNGQAVSSGIYYYTLTYGNGKSIIKKSVLIK